MSSLGTGGQAPYPEAKGWAAEACFFPVAKAGWAWG